MAQYDSFIGLEIHVQLNTATKIFCSCPNRFGDEPNTNVCPVCLGYPGSLPALNEQVLQKAVTLCTALNCSISNPTHFERKNYFYPDLPKNYQVSQFERPIGTKGWVEFEYKGEIKRVRIHEAHMEEDAGKMIHAGDMSLLDYNRAGTPLLEIVTEPDMTDPEEAEALLLELRKIVRYLNVSDGNMEEGSLRCDANVSINHPGKGLGQKVEVKNVNSSRFVRKALAYEIDRQSAVMDQGGQLRQETRLWNENRDQTEVMRTKENANDYRYFKEPDLPVYTVDDHVFEIAKKAQTELPLYRKKHMIENQGIAAQHAEFMVEERSIADFYHAVVAKGNDPKQVAAWLNSDVQRLLNKEGTTLEQSPLSPEYLDQILKALDKGSIHGKIAKKVLELVFDEKKSPEQIIKDHGLEQITDSGALSTMVEEVFSANSQAVEQVLAGESKAIGFLIGAVMKVSAGKADPKLVQTAVKEALDAKRQ